MASKPKAPKANKAPVAAEPPAISRFQKYTMQTISRRDIKNAAYNPRKISERAKTLLRQNIERVGLVEPITWNKRSGNIVGGHQRIAAMDALERTSDYLLTVAAVDLDEATEKEQNVFLNNPNAQGDFDLEKLSELVSAEDLNGENMGFSLAELYQMFGDNPQAGGGLSAEDAAELSEQVQKNRELYRKLLDRTNGEDDVDFYCVVVFKDNAAREAFCKLYGADDNRYLDGRHLAEILEEAKLALGGNGSPDDGVAQDPIPSPVPTPH